MAVAALIVWLFTAGLGIALLAALGNARRREPASGDGVAVPAGGAGGAAAEAAADAAMSAAVAEVTGSAGAVGVADVSVPPGGAADVGPDGAVTGGTATSRASHRPDGHPLLEFAHPALGILGLGCWFVYVATKAPGLAWASAGILAVTICAGVSWLAVNVVTARHRAGGRRWRAVPVRVIVSHGLAAAATFTLAVLTLLALPGH